MAENTVFVNIEDGIERMMGNEDIYLKLLEKYKDDKSLEKSIAAINEKNWDEAKIAVHTLKGVASNLSLTELASRAAELEMRVKDGADVSEYLEKVITANAKTIEEIDRIIAAKN